jgi:two-component system sensor histidine kinase YesM
MGAEGMPRWWKNRMDRAMFRLEQLTLQTRLVIAYILIILLPTVLISVYIFRGLTGDTIDELTRTNENALEIEQIHIKNNMETMKRAAQMTEQTEKVLDYLSQPMEPGAQELIDLDNETVRMGILRLQYNNPGLELIRLYMSNPYTFEIWPVFLKESRVAGDAWYKPVMDKPGRDVWFFSRYTRELLQSRLSTEEENKPKISLYRELQYPKGTHVGILEIDMALANFFPNTFNPLKDELAQTVIVDSEGSMYRDPSTGFFDREGLSEEVLRSQLGSLDAAADGKGSFDFQAEGVPYLAVYSYIEPLGAYMLRIVALEHVLKDINTTRNNIILANIILLAILTLSTYWLNAIILKKLHVLTDSMKKVRQGDFASDIDIRGGGEVGELAHHFRKMLRKINELIADAVHKQAAAKEAELAALKNQIDSHFLYNTLENVKMMAEVQDQRAISDALTSLGSMMRYNMSWTSEYVRLKDEWSHIAHYVNIANVRFGDLVELVTDIPEGLLDQELLKMSLQPVVENAVKHGLQDDVLTISLRAEADGEATLISVIDNGCGIPPERLRELNRRIMEGERRGTDEPGDSGRSRSGSGIGLVNVNSRIQMHYGKEYGLQVDSVQGRFTRVSIRIPHFVLGGGGS